MFNALLKHNDIIEDAIINHKGLVVKNLGDSYMAYFDSISNAIECAIFIQKQPVINVAEDRICIRIGLACGRLYQKEYKIQNCKLVDFFGHTVNVAARLEANVSPIGGIAFSIIGKQVLSKELKNLIESKNFKIKPTEFKSFCKKKISNSPIYGNECRLTSDIKGVGDLQAFLLKPN